MEGATGERKRKGEPWRQDQGVCLDELPLPAAPLGAGLVGSLRVQEKAETRGAGGLQGAFAWVLRLGAFYLSLTVGILGEVLGAAPWIG